MKEEKEVLLHKLPGPPPPESGGPRLGCNGGGAPRRNGHVKGCAAAPLPPRPPPAGLASRRALFGLGAAGAAALLWGLRGDSAAAALAGLCGSLSPLFSLACAFFFLARYLARDHPGGGLGWLLALPLCCYAGDWAALQWPLLPPPRRGQPDKGAPAQAPPPAELQVAAGRLLAALGAVAGLTLWQRRLKLRRSLLVLLFSSLAWLLSLTGLGSLPPALRPLLSALVGAAGCLLALERRLFSACDSPPGRGPQRRPHHCQPRGAEEKVPVVRPRRRSSCVSLGETATGYHSSCKASRRPSLPCISKEQPFYLASSVTFPYSCSSDRFLSNLLPLPLIYLWEETRRSAPESKCLMVGIDRAGSFLLGEEEPDRAVAVTLIDSGADLPLRLVCATIQSLAEAAAVAQCTQHSTGVIMMTSLPSPGDGRILPEVIFEARSLPPVPSTSCCKAPWGQKGKIQPFFQIAPDPT
ncbi:UNVERIFIED_CONTAM: hypothetical protein K2H54_059385 [Gekko kuhli]